MAQDTVNHAGICYKGDDTQASPTAAQEGIRFEDFFIRRAHVLLCVCFSDPNRVPFSHIYQDNKFENGDSGVNIVRNALG